MAAIATAGVVLAHTQVPAMTVMVGDVVVPVRRDRWGVIATITPRVAQALLAQNENNRKLRATRIDLYARDMARDAWWLNGEALTFDADGNCLSAQHRLHACVKSGVSFESYIIGDVDQGARDSIDQVLAKSAADILDSRGEPDARTLASGLMVAWRIETNGNLFAGAGFPWPTRSDLFDYLDANPNIRQSVPVAVRVAKQLRYPKSVAMGLHYLMSSIDAADADEFFERLSDGVGLYPGNPVLVLRGVIQKNAGAAKRPQSIDVAAITIKAWLAFRDRRSVKTLRWRRKGKAQESFPTFLPSR